MTFECTFAITVPLVSSYVREGLLKELASIVGGGERIDISHPQIHQHGIKAGIYILMQMACCDDAVGTSSPWGGSSFWG